MSEGTQVDLTVENSIDFLKRYIDIGYRTGTLTIKDGATICQWFRILKGLEKSTEIDSLTIYKRILALVDTFNKNKAYGLDDAGVLNTLITFVNENQLKTPEEPVQKIKEI